MKEADIQKKYPLRTRQLMSSSASLAASVYAPFQVSNASYSARTPEKIRKARFNVSQDHNYVKCPAFEISQIGQSIHTGISQINLANLHQKREEQKVSVPANVSSIGADYKSLNINIENKSSLFCQADRVNATLKSKKRKPKRADDDLISVKMKRPKFLKNIQSTPASSTIIDVSKHEFINKMSPISTSYRNPIVLNDNSYKYHSRTPFTSLVPPSCIDLTEKLEKGKSQKTSAKGIKDPDFIPYKLDKGKSKKDSSCGKCKSTKKEKAPPPEKRLKRLRKSMDVCRERIDRALSQRLFLIKRDDIIYDEIGAIRAGFTVLGSTGNVYSVTIGRLVECTCPDHQRNGRICKHIIFIMVRVLKQSRHSNLIIQTALLSSELETIFANVSSNPNDTAVLAKPAVRAAIFGEASVDANEKENEDKRKPIGNDDDCGVCFEALIESTEAQLDWCRDGCGKSIHKQCWNMWKKQGHNTCVYCRCQWRAHVPANTSKKTAGGGKVRLSEGYLNVGQLQGQSRVRDTSTYNPYYW